MLNRKDLRSRVAGWKPGMTIEVRVDELTELLDQCDFIEARLEEMQRLVRELVTSLEEG